MDRFGSRSKGKETVCSICLRIASPSLAKWVDKTVLQKSPQRERNLLNECDNLSVNKSGTQPWITLAGQIFSLAHHLQNDVGVFARTLPDLSLLTGCGGGGGAAKPVLKKSNKNNNPRPFFCFWNFYSSERNAVMVPPQIFIQTDKYGYDPAGPDGISCRTTRALAEQLAQPFPQFRPDVAEQQIRP